MAQADAAGHRLDGIMERASRALVARAYFEAERLASEALHAALAAADYERMARICLPLQEARRQKRDLAFDAGGVYVVDEHVPAGADLRPGCYLVQPPRVGLDGRLLREALDKAEVPAIVIVREPTTRSGLWPVVALGPVTLRTPVRPPYPCEPETVLIDAPGGPRRGPTKRAKGKKGPPALPTREWFLAACEALGDSGIESMDPARSAIARVEDLHLRLAAHPDHEKLHQALADACREAAKEVRDGAKPRPRREDAAPRRLADDEFDDEF